MTEFEKTNCLICSSGEYYTYTTKGQFGLTTNVVICKKCGFSYLNPRWTEERYHSFYSREYDALYRKFVRPYEAIEQIVARSQGIIDYSKKGINILDIGSGMGDSLIYLRKNMNPGASFFAIEASENCIANLNKNEISVITNDVNADWHLDNENKFDIIIMRHVLEHLSDPIEVLKKIHLALKPDGIFYVAVPNSKIPTQPLRGHFFRVVHISYFSELSLSNALRLSGLKAFRMIPGDKMDKKEIFAFCKKSEKENIVILENEWKVQKQIYDSCKRLELYYKIKDFISKKIILPLTR